MHKILKWILWVAVIVAVFFAGFYIGTMDADAHKIKITSQCAGIGIEKSFSSNYERINGTVVRDEKTNTETYTARCLCFASDATHKNIWVDTVELSGDTADAVRTTCDTDCQRLCEGRLADFTFAE